MNRRDKSKTHPYAELIVYIINRILSGNIEDFLTIGQKIGHILNHTEGRQLLLEIQEFHLRMCVLLLLDF